MRSRRAPALLALALLILPALPLGAAWAEVTLGNFRKEGATGYADVTYANNTDTVFSTVKIECVPPGTAGRRAHINLYLSNPLGGGIQPGHTETRTISFPLAEEQKPEDVSCEARELPLVTP